MYIVMYTRMCTRYSVHNNVCYLYITIYGLYFNYSWSSSAICSAAAILSKNIHNCFTLSSIDRGRLYATVVNEIVLCICYLKPVVYRFILWQEWRQDQIACRGHYTTPGTCKYDTLYCTPFFKWNIRITR